MRIAAVLVLAACTHTAAPPDHDVTGPFTGYVERFAVDSIQLPTTSNQARELGDDLDGDGHIDNRLGGATASLFSFGDLNHNVAPMIAARAIESTLEVLADDHVNDDTVAVTYFGTPGVDAVEVGGTLVDGTFFSNRTATTRIPGRAQLRLPVFANASASMIELDAMEIDLTPDGGGGYDAVLRGGVPHDVLDAAVTTGITQMIARSPADHLPLAQLIDDNRDGQLTAAEITKQGGFVESLIQPDITLHGDSLVSFAFSVHLAPCNSTPCSTGTVLIDPCHDGIQDNDETDVDCGGSCQGCPAGARCGQAIDCLSHGCDAGACRAPTCSDGIQDGLETDVDCGWNCPSKCANTKHCVDNSDCTSGHCTGGGLSNGTCS